MAISLVRSARPEILLPFMSTTIRSSACIIPFAHARGGGQNPLRVHPDGDIAIVGCHPAFLEYQPADLADVLAILALRFHHCGIFDCSKDVVAARDLAGIPPKRLHTRQRAPHDEIAALVWRNLARKTSPAKIAPPGRWRCSNRFPTPLEAVSSSGDGSTTTGRGTGESPAPVRSARPGYRARRRR